MLSLATILGMAACGFKPGENIASDGSLIDTPLIDSALDGPRAPRSCKELHAVNPGLANGNYMVDIAGTPTAVDCDMTTDGGGWTLVFFAASNDEMSTNLGYIPGLGSVLGGADAALITYRATSLTTAGSYASLAIPTAWRTSSPFTADGTDLVTPVQINGAPASPATVRYGFDSFTNNCADPWFAGGHWGRICIPGTEAPFYNGFAAAGIDLCSASSVAWNTTSCSTALRFSIAVR
ncbi:hypothetical protein BH11MYX1_BH11MYX1_36750 [soil metagenome]